MSFAGVLGICWGSLLFLDAVAAAVSDFIEDCREEGRGCEA
jgi:hypothetical protein